jgi:5-hydroxyisourate hydrolase-like protein (transthyretin family)
MKTKNILPVLVLICGMAFNASSQTITTTPTNGPTFKGRVLDDATGKPVADVPIRYWFEYESIGTGHGFYETRTDAEGRYEGRYEPKGGTGAGHYTMEIQPTNYAWQVFKVDRADTAKMASIPDARLLRGGWISGLAKHPAEVAPNDYPYIRLYGQGPLPEHTLLPVVEAGRDGKFRTPPLSAGTYALQGQWLARSTNGGRVSVVGLVTGISNIIVIADQETANVVIPTNYIVYTNRASSR